MASPTSPITDNAVTPSRPLAISMGEPGGVGTELLFKAYRHFADFPPGKGPQFFLIDDPFRVEKLSRELDANIPIVTLRHPQETAEQFQHGLPILPLDEDMIDPLRYVKLGEASASTAKAVIASLDAAVTFVCDGTASGLVTLPIQKEALQEAGFSHPGHTDYLGELTKEIAMPKGMARGPVMLLTAGPFRVAPVTVHIPLSQVAPSLSADSIVRTGMVVAQSLARDYGILTPKIAVAGLNPHAGEGGMLGTEDENIIAPAIAALRAQGVDAFGPLPGDTMFHEEARSLYHAALTMYHDQGLIPIKTIAFYAAVNTTIGLPIVRTSPDHGTALQIAGKGIARPDSLTNAIYAADRMAKARASFDVHYAK